MSCGLIVFKSPSIPSIKTNGSPLVPWPMVVVPRTLILGVSSKLPLVWVICNPGTTPCRACAALVTGRSFSSSAVTTPTEPVRFTFFWVPKPTTTTSSSISESSSNFTSIVFPGIASTTTVLYPIKDISNLVA